MKTYLKITAFAFAATIAYSPLASAQMTPVGPPKSAPSTMTKPVMVQPLNLPNGYSAGAIEGSLSNGQKLTSLRWAENSAVACFPGTRFEMFDGNHVFYKMTLPAASEMKITLRPKNRDTINLYALRQGQSGMQVPPNVTSAISCEASHPIYANVSETRKIKNADDGIRNIELISVNKPYNILIGVAGAEGLTQGGYTLQVEINDR